MITIIWDPINGWVFPEGMVVQKAKDLLGIAKAYQGVGNIWPGDDPDPRIIPVGQAEIINEVRLMVARKELDTTEVEILVDGKRLEWRTGGRLGSWPKGFCDLLLNQATELARIQSEIYKKKKNE